jgi:hypothetical protein
MSRGIETYIDIFAPLIILVVLLHFTQRIKQGPGKPNGKVLPEEKLISKPTGFGADKESNRFIFVLVLMIVLALTISTVFKNP